VTLKSDVMAESPLVQARSGERSFTIPTSAVENLPIANRSFTAIASLAPGVTVGISNGQPTSASMFGVATCAACPELGRRAP
jgi:hypothetical protein